MLTHRVITSLDLPELAPYRTLRRPLDHQRQGIFVAEGSRVVRRLVESPLQVLSCLLTPEWLQAFEDILLGRSPLPDLLVADKELLSHIVGFHFHQGAMAVGRIPPPVSTEEIAGDLSRPLLLVALDGITNAENVGVLVRNSAAFGVDGLIVGETSSSPYLRRSVRNSMGTVFGMRIVHTDGLAATLREFHGRYAIETIAAHPPAEPPGPGRMPFTRRSCLVFGSEGTGISREILSVCSAQVSIGMAAGVDSLNVASASAVLLYEARRLLGQSPSGST